MTNKVMHLAHAHVHGLTAEIESKSLERSLVRADRHQQRKSVERVPGRHLLPPCPSHQMGAEAEVRKMPNMKRIPREEWATEIIHRLVVVHHEEADRTRAAAAEAVAEAGVHRLSHQRQMAAEVKERRVERERNERSHGLHLIPVTVGVGAGVKATTVAVNYHRADSN